MKGRIAHNLRRLKCDESSAGRSYEDAYRRQAGDRTRARRRDASAVRKSSGRDRACTPHGDRVPRGWVERKLRRGGLARSIDDRDDLRSTDTASAVANIWATSARAATECSTCGFAPALPRTAASFGVRGVSGVPSPVPIRARRACRCMAWTGRAYYDSEPGGAGGFRILYEPAGVRSSRRTVRFRGSAPESSMPQALPGPNAPRGRCGSSPRK
jgi:hypothetical protein